MKLFIKILLVLLAINGYAQSAPKPDLGAGISSYQKFLIYPHIEKGMSALEVGDNSRAIQEFLWARKRAPKAA